MKGGRVRGIGTGESEKGGWGKRLVLGLRGGLLPFYSIHGNGVGACVWGGGRRMQEDSLVELVGGLGLETAERDETVARLGRELATYQQARLSPVR